MTKAKKINKEGLKAIFGDDFKKAFNDIETFSEKSKNGFSTKIKVKEIRPNPFQPRKIFKDEELQQLANSIKEQGLVQPIVVNKDIKGYTLIAGERRLRAHKILGLKEIEAIIVSYNKVKMEEVALIENIQREELNAIEEANALDSLIKTHKITQEDLAKRISKSRSYVTNSIRLLKLPKKIQEYVLDGKLQPGHAKVLLALDDNKIIIMLANKIISKGLSVRATENLVRAIKEPKIIKIKIPTNEFTFAEDQIRDKFKTRVTITKKEITIKYTNVSDLNRIMSLMGVIE